MPEKKAFLITSLYIFLFSGIAAFGQQKFTEPITGEWIAAKKNLIVLVYKVGNEYNARIMWFNDSDDKTRDMKSRLDKYNQVPALRTRHILGLEVVRNLTYVKRTSTYENGIIYDARTGREWDSYAYLTSANTLRVKGYWHFKFISQTMDFYRLPLSKAPVSVNK